jgi:sulfoxide reductase heme-binding subunit YedZ
VWAAFHAGLGVNPVEYAEHQTGDWALNFICASLCMTPMARLTKSSWWAKHRRMIGLFAGFYATLHFLVYFGIDQELSVSDAWHDVAKRPYITVGFAAFVILAALSLTSTDAMIRRMKRWWGRLHKLVYVAAALAVVHYYWLVKSDHRGPLRYAVVIGALLSYRAVTKARSTFNW